jgi:hypothetical protein
MERHCSTGQSPQWAVAPMEEEGSMMAQTLTAVVRKFVNQKCLSVNQIMIITTYEGNLESKERSRIQPAQLFQCS